MSDRTNNYLKLENRLKQITHLKNIASLAHWDAEINLPTASTANRHQELATLAEIIHQMSVAKELGDLIEAATQEVSELNEWQKANLALIRRTYEHAQCISPKLQHSYTMAISECEYIWRDARKNSNFKQLVPHLNQVFEISRTIADCKAKHFQKDPYDMLMDTYEADSSAKEIQEVFDVLKRELPKLIEKITAKQQNEKIIPLSEKIDINTQKAIGLHIMERMGFDMDKG